MKKIRFLLTDIQVHANMRQVSTNLNRKIEQSLNSQKPGRFYGSVDNIKRPEVNKVHFSIPLPANYKETDESYEIEFLIPKDGLPTKTNEDMDKLVESKHVGRILRKLAKKDENE